ncbi:hypothetical protein Q6D67_20360 [Haliea sp. E1-2-M8]|uniref:hypothetical protein n=1 Tax=Haliea sp. E1-2-M8 TaxID=3064706 RepID=UPI0027248626|nr:hypothetical protein [Haliea sp. E1-2-M8]MDO8864044.1 hypothetical protein [Haliea sp. E1-2-M8]
MTNVSVLVPTAASVCQHCVDNSRHQSEQVGAVWCEHTRCGGIYFVERGQWHVVGPFREETEFKRWLLMAFSPGMEH